VNNNIIFLIIYIDKMLSASELYLSFSPPDYNYKQLNSYMNDPVELFTERATNNSTSSSSVAKPAGKTRVVSSAGTTSNTKSAGTSAGTSASTKSINKPAGKTSIKSAGKTSSIDDTSLTAEETQAIRSSNAQIVKNALNEAKNNPNNIRNMSADDKVNLVKIADAESLAKLSQIDNIFIKTAVVSNPEKARDAILLNANLYTADMQRFLKSNAPEVDIEITNQLIASRDIDEIAKLSEIDNSLIRNILSKDTRKALEIIDKNPNIYKGDFKKFVEENHPDIATALNEKYGIMIEDEIDEIDRIEERPIIRGSGLVMRGYKPGDGGAGKGGVGKISEPKKGVNTGLATLLNIPTEASPAEVMARTDIRELTRAPASKIVSIPSDLPTEQPYIAPPPVETPIPKSVKLIKRVQEGKEQIGFYDQFGKFVVVSQDSNASNEMKSRIEERTILRPVNKPTYAARLKDKDSYEIEKDLSELFTMMPQSSKSKGFSTLNPYSRHRTERFIENAENRFADIETRRRKNIMPTYIDEIRSPSSATLRNVTNSDSLSKDNHITEMPDALKPSESPFVLQYPAEDPRYNSMYNKLYGNLYGSEKSHQDLPANQSYVARPILNPDKVRRTILEKNKSGNIRDYLMTQVKYNLKYKPKDNSDDKLYDKLLRQIPEERMFEYLYTLEEQNAVDRDLEIIKENERLAANTENALDLAKGRVLVQSKKPKNLTNMFVQESFEESKGGFKRTRLSDKIKRSTNPILNAVVQEQRKGSMMTARGQSDAVMNYIDPLNAQFAGDLLSKLSRKTKSDRHIRARRVKDLALNEQISKEEGVDEFTGDLLYDHSYLGAPLEWRYGDGVENFEGSVANIWDSYTKYDYGSIGKQDVTYTGTSNTDLQQGFSAIVLPGNPVGSYVNYERLPYNVMPHESYSVIEYKRCSDNKEKETLIPRRSQRTNGCNARRVRQLD
jgi:hypothetical protein